MFARNPLPANAVQQLLANTTLGSASESLARAQQAPEQVEQVMMDVQNNGLLAISWVPTFRFMPRWSRRHRVAIGKVVGVEGSRLMVVFDAGQHKAPPMAVTTTFWNALWPIPVPVLPPGISIDIKSHELKGWIDVVSGEVEFKFDSEFGNQAFGRAASRDPLKVCSRMTSEPISGNIFHAVGMRMQADGQAKLVALTEVPITEDKVQNWLLKLPTDALSTLNVRFEFVMKPTAGRGRTEEAPQGH